RAAIFSYVTPRPPSSTLFPYTTLFRSSTAENAGLALAGRSLEFRCRPITVRRARRRLRRRGAATKRGHGDRSQHEQRERLRQPLDRKSTRLNSSHRTISYAVLCLKKKK